MAKPGCNQPGYRHFRSRKTEQVGYPSAAPFVPRVCHMAVRLAYIAATHTPVACGAGPHEPQAASGRVRLDFSLTSNHAFVDGRKRIGMYAMLTFLEANGIHMECSNQDVINAGLAVADGSMK